MKKLFTAISTASFTLFMGVSTFAATAHLEGEEDDSALSFLDRLNIDSNYLMTNWYKFILVAVVAGCVLGVIISNVCYLAKKYKEKKKA